LELGKFNDTIDILYFSSIEKSAKCLTQCIVISGTCQVMVENINSIYTRKKGASPRDFVLVKHDANANSLQASIFIHKEIG